MEAALKRCGKHHTLWSAQWASLEKRTLEIDLFAYFAVRRIGEIESIELLAALRCLEGRGAVDVARRVVITARAA